MQVSENKLYFFLNSAFLILTVWFGQNKIFVIKLTIFWNSSSPPHAQFTILYQNI